MKKVILLAAALLLTSKTITAQTSRTPDWTHNIDITNSDQATDIWVNPEGETYAFARIVNYNDHLDALVITKTNNQGQEVWRRFLYAVNANWQLFANAVTGDENGNVYFMYNEKTRYTDSNRNRIAIRKYSPTGDLIWNQYLTDSVENRTEEANRRVLEYKNGALYLLGSMYDESLWTTQDLDGILYKVNANNGSVIFRKVYNSQYSSDDVLKDLAVNDNGEIWAIGRSRGYAYSGNIYSNYDSFTLKWNANGDLQWERRLNGAGNGEDFGINLTVDAAGNCYTSSQLKRLYINALQVVIEKLSPDGTVLWSTASVSSSTGYTAKQPVKILPNGNVVFATSNSEGINIIALNSDNGTQAWATNFNRNNLGAQNRQSDLAVDHNGNIYITGSSRDNTPYGDGIDMTTLKYSPDGQFEWYSHITFGNYATAGDFGDVVKWNPANESVYIVGSVQDANYNSNYLIAKYGESALEVPTLNQSPIQVYPNPTRDIVNVKLKPSENIAFELYDINGRLIRQWQADNQAEDHHQIDLSGVTQGVYVLKVNADDYNFSHKVIKS